jgi:hypothetical protein
VAWAWNRACRHQLSTECFFDAAVTGGTVAALNDQMALEPGDRTRDDAETSIAAPLGHGTLANVSAADHVAQDPPAVGRGLTIPNGPAVRDAESIAARIATDEAAADAARDQYAAHGIPVIEPVAGFAGVAQPGEPLHAVLHNAILEQAPADGDSAVLRGGTVYLTSSRLLHVGGETTDVPLGEIEEMVVALERLVLIRLRDGSDLAVEVDQPRLLRVQIAAAVAAARAAASAS